jgi:tetratricopeptide (TPR) repeat protein
MWVFVSACFNCSAQPAKTVDNQKSRSFVISEEINHAIASYSLIAKYSDNPVLISEYAYALALGGIYDAALVQLDRIWLIEQTSVDVNFFTSQVFLLMDQFDLASVFWKENQQNKIPGWIASKSALLLQKYKRKSSVQESMTQEEVIAKFKLANDMASGGSLFQSLELYREIIDQCPDEFLPYVGFSLTLQKIGANEKSLRILEKGISVIPDDTEHREIKQILEKRKASIKQNIYTSPEKIVLPLHKIKESEILNSQMMAYVGGMIAPSYSNFNGRFGYFVSGKSNASIDLGVTKTSGSSYSNIGLSMYSRKEKFVFGTGLQAILRDGSSSFYAKISIGLSFMNKKRTASFDVFLDGNAGLSKGAPTLISMSVGRSVYFGKRR